MAASDRVHFEPWKESNQKGEKREEIDMINSEKSDTVQYHAEGMQRRIASLQSSYELPPGNYF